jgi:hypothetical protein
MDIRHELQICPCCNGIGWTVEHDPSDPHIGGVCTNCPVQVQCKECEGTGIVWKKDIKKKQKNNTFNELPF